MSIHAMVKIINSSLGKNNIYNPKIIFLLNYNNQHTKIWIFVNRFYSFTKTNAWCVKRVQFSNVVIPFTLKMANIQGSPGIHLPQVSGVKIRLEKSFTTRPLDA